MSSYDAYYAENHWERRLVLFFLVVGPLLGVADFVSDVLNYRQFATYVHEDDAISHPRYTTMVDAYLGLVIVAGIIYGLEVIFTLFALVFRWHLNTNERQAIMWVREVCSIVDAILCDLSILILYYISFGSRYCPMLYQMRTVRGKVAVALTTSHAIFALIQSGYYRVIVGRYPSRCEQAMKSAFWIIHTIISVLGVLACIAAFIYSDHSESIKLQFHKWGIGESENTHLYLVQNIYVSDHINDQYKFTPVYNSTGESDYASEQFDNRYNDVIQCQMTHQAFLVTDTQDVMKAGEDGVFYTFKCSEALPKYKLLINDEHKTYLNEADCVLVVRIRYDFRRSLISYDSGYELHLHNQSLCLYDKLDLTYHRDDSKTNIYVPVDDVHWVNRLVLGRNCSLNHSCGDTDRRNLFSCMDKQCETYNSTDGTSVLVSPFSLTSLSTTLPYSWQCNARTYAEPLDLHLCTNYTQVPRTATVHLTKTCISSTYS